MLMTLDEAIAHCYEVAGGCDACAAEHLQLAHWLEELKHLRKESVRLSKMISGLAEIERTMKLNQDYLDTLDLEPFLHKGQELYYIVEEISEKFANDPNMPEELEGEVFNFLSDYEVGEYLAERYGVKVREDIEVRYYLD